MRQFIAAIAVALAAMARTATRWVKRAGRWVLEALPGGGAPAPAQNVHQAAAAEAQRGDEEALACIRAAAASIATGKVPAPSITGRMDSDAFRWLMACDDNMLRSVVRAENAELRAHLQGRKSIRSVLAFDREAIAAIERSKMANLGAEPADDIGYRTAMAM